MIRDPLALERERTKPGGARRRCRRRDALERLRVRPRIRDGAVSRHASREPIRVAQRHLLESLFDALVNVTQPLLEAQDFLADDLEAEVSGLDDAGVHRSDGNLVHSVACDPDERVLLLPGLPLRQRHEIAAQRELIDRPARHPRPRSMIFAIGRGADEVERRPLHPVRRREDRRHVGMARVRRIGQRVLEDREAVRIVQRDAQQEAAMAVALVARPERDEMAAAFPREPARRQQLAGAHRHTPRGQRRG